MNKKYILLASIAPVLLIIFLIVNSLTAFRQTNSKPLSGANNFSPKSTISVSFNHSLDKKLPFEEVTVSPVTEGDFSTKDNTIVFTPRVALNGNMNYMFTVKKPKDSRGRTIKDVVIKFKTGEYFQSTAEKSLPYVGDGFTIDRLADSQIIITITSAPRAKYEADARQYLKSAGIDDARASVIVSASARYSKQEPDILPQNLVD